MCSFSGGGAHQVARGAGMHLRARLDSDAQARCKGRRYGDDDATPLWVTAARGRGSSVILCNGMSLRCGICSFFFVSCYAPPLLLLLPSPLPISPCTALSALMHTDTPSHPPTNTHTHTNSLAAVSQEGWNERAHVKQRTPSGWQRARRQARCSRPQPSCSGQVFPLPLFHVCFRHLSRRSAFLFDSFPLLLGALSQRLHLCPFFLSMPPPLPSTPRRAVATTSLFSSRCLSA